jgi:hypothetical protein
MPKPCAAPTLPRAAAPAPGPPPPIQQPLNLPSVGGQGTTNDGDWGGEPDPAAPPRGHGGPSLRWPLPLGSASDRHVLLIDLTV